MRLGRVVWRGKLRFRTTGMNVGTAGGVESVVVIFGKVCGLWEIRLGRRARAGQ